MGLLTVLCNVAFEPRVVLLVKLLLLLLLLLLRVATVLLVAAAAGGGGVLAGGVATATAVGVNRRVQRHEVSLAAIGSCC